MTSKILKAKPGVIKQRQNMKGYMAELLVHFERHELSYSRTKASKKYEIDQTLDTQQ